ncbi:TPA: single-stranded-DNA-specific exonuclease RecJ [Candidatus Taylorbacteria bacterium]|nr:single-stranded-DNA-specific exonuclease RecJ [Candidatus Taylorbacteria bacterium]
MSKYSVREKIPESAASELAVYPELMRGLLFYRGADSALKAEKYLNPHFENDAHDPFLMKDMDKAVARILQAIEKKEKIIVYSDYDADGVPGAVVLSDFFKKIGVTNFEVYIPHRHLEGFGLHKNAIDTFKEKKATLMITIDCGIADVEEVVHAQSLGIDVIVTDHHLPVNSVPKAFAVLDAKQDGCEYPYKMLCGSGVVYKLIQAILQKNRFGMKEGAEKWLLDMVGIATCADMVPLQGENRMFAHYGLKVLRKSPRLGLMKLLRKMNVSQMNITEDDIGFMIAPRINAASRMGVPMDAFNLLSTTDETEAGVFTDHLHSINEERKGIVAGIVKELHKRIADRSDFEKHPVLVIGDPRWKPSLLGLAANTLMEKYKRPVFLWGREDGTEIKGSCRSDGSVDLVEMMQEVSTGVFTHFGGHAMSGGFAVEHDRIHHLEEELHAAYLKKKKNKDAEQIFIDAVIGLDDVTWQNFRSLEKMMPFGLANEKPIFLFENVVVESVRKFGKKTDHLELVFRNKRGDKVSAIGFFAKPEDFANVPAAGKKINLIASLEKSVFAGRTELRLRIVDVI